MSLYKRITWVSERKFLDDLGLIGGKGVGLKKMKNLGLPVPDGFILTTKAWKDYIVKEAIDKELLIDIRNSVKTIEKKYNCTFGGKEGNKPLLLSVRSGAKYSMPGMMDTILNVGIAKDSIPSLIEYFKDEVFVYDIYRRFVKLFASAVFDMHQGDFDLLDDAITLEGNFSLNQQIDLIEQYEQIILQKVNKVIPQNPYDQLDMAIGAVFDSWQNPSAISYRKINGIPDDIGTAVIVQQMVFGNFYNSCTGVLFTKNPENGDNELYGNYLSTAQGEDIVRGASSRVAKSIHELKNDFPEQAKELFDYALQLENQFKDVQDIEFTIENGKVWLLQTRNAKRSPLANIRITKYLLENHIISKDIALSRIKPSDIKSLTVSKFDGLSEITCAGAIFSIGETASAGVAVGKLVLSVEAVHKNYELGQDSILVCDHIDPNDISTLVKVKAVVTTKGSTSSHMSIIMRSLGLPGIVGCREIKIAEGKIKNLNGVEIVEGDLISVDATKGIIYSKPLKLGSQSGLPKDLHEIIKSKETQYGKSEWSVAQYSENRGGRLAELKTKIQDAHKLSNSKWKSQKAQISEVLNTLFTDKQMHSSKVFEISDIEEMKKYMIETIYLGYVNAPRTSHFPEKLAGAPYACGPNILSEVDEFFANKDFPGKYGGYLGWVEDKTLDAIILSREPKGKMNTDLAMHHFACTLTCVSSNPANLVVNIVLGTPHLRSLERVESENLIIMKVAINQNFEYDLGHRIYLFGENLFEENKVESLLRKMKSLIKNPKLPHRNIKIVHLIRQINIVFPNADLLGYEVADLKKTLSELMIRNSFQEDLYDLVVSKTTLQVLDQIYKSIFVKLWKPPVALPYVMSALDDVLGLSVLEMQGRIKGNKLAWFKIYGAKGAEEKEKVQIWKVSNLK
jgi:phosphohistidine swiveling domain-containing protein